MNKKNAWDQDGPQEKPDGKLLTPDCTVLTVKIIEDDTDYLHTGLGISNKEARRLQKIMENIIERGKNDDGEFKDKRGNNIANLLCELSTHCIHANRDHIKHFIWYDTIHECMYAAYTEYHPIHPFLHFRVNGIVQDTNKLLNFI